MTPEHPPAWSWLDIVIIVVLLGFIAWIGSHIHRHRSETARAYPSVYVADAPVRTFYLVTVSRLGPGRDCQRAKRGMLDEMGDAPFTAYCTPYPPAEVPP